MRGKEEIKKTGVCFGRSVALPPQIIITSILSFQSSTSATLQTVAVSVRILTSSGFLLVNTATSSISSFCFTAHSTPLPKQTPVYAKMFNVIDSFDTHARIPEHFANVDAAAKEGGHVGIISVGWDPGMFSLNRLYANAILPDGNDYTFWGKGVSQGHSDAIRRVEGVKDGKQYTIPVEAALKAVRNGENPELTTRQKHTRECFVVAEEGADLAQIENDIKTMPNYFSDYDTTVHFISEEELKRDHSGIPHGGFVIRSGKTGWNDENNHVIEYSLKLDSNPEFTSSVLVAYARAAYRMNKEGQSGAKTVFDVAPAYLCAADGAELRKHLL